MMYPMILVGHYDSPYVRRVAVSLHELGMSFGRRPLSVFRHMEDVRQFNPLGRVPALVLDGGETVIDSAAILDYLDERVGPARALLPPGGTERRQALRLIALATGANDKAMAIAYERRRHDAKIDESWILRCTAQLAGSLDHLDRHADWNRAGRPMQPEITTATMLGYVRLRLPEALPAGRYRNLNALSAACEALPAFTACLPTLEEIGGPEEEARKALFRLQGGPARK